MGAAVGAAGGGAILDATSFATLGRLMLAASLMMTAAALIWLPRIAPVQVARVGLSEMLAGYVSMLRRGYVRPFIAIRAAAQHLLGDRGPGDAVCRRYAHRL